MTMGEYIKILRESIGLSQEELGNALIPPVNRSAICKWESGMVENIKRTHILQLAQKFGVSAADLMCFDDRRTTSITAREINAFEEIECLFGKEAVMLLRCFQELNDTGKSRLLEEAGDLTLIHKYTEKRESQKLRNA